MKINDNLPIVPTPNKDLLKLDGSQKAANLSSLSSPVAPNISVPSPAANVDIAVTMKLAESQNQKESTTVSDKALIDKIKAKIASGTFEIDYDQISQSILQESLAQIGARSGR